MLAAVQAIPKVFQILNVFRRIATAVYKTSIVFALVILQVFWFVPLTLLGAMFGDKFRDSVRRIVAPASIGTGNSNNDDDNG
jgi:hypothetical protein